MATENANEGFLELLIHQSITERVQWTGKEKEEGERGRRKYKNVRIVLIPIGIVPKHKPQHTLSEKVREMDTKRNLNIQIGLNTNSSLKGNMREWVRKRNGRKKIEKGVRRKLTRMEWQQKKQQ